MTSKPEEAPSPAERRQPKQSRSVETFNAILQAAANLFEAKGYEVTTTHQIASEAGVSVGALYRYFDGKQAILKELYARETSGSRRRILEGFSLADFIGQDLGQLVRKTMALAFKIFSERPGLRRVLTEQARKIDELDSLRRSQGSEVRQAVRQILGAAPMVTVPDKEAAAYLVSLFMESLIDDYLLYRRTDSDFGDERIIEASSDFIMSYLLGRRD
jgi:AcrR family transcriptional regulator